MIPKNQFVRFKYNFAVQNCIVKSQWNI